MSVEVDRAELLRQLSAANRALGEAQGEVIGLRRQLELMTNERDSALRVLNNVADLLRQDPAAARDALKMFESAKAGRQ